MSDVGGIDESTLKLSCKNSDCVKNLHAFRATKAQVNSGTAGACRNCGADLINWSRVRARDLVDVAHTIDSLKKEWIRHRYWERELNQHAINYALRKGRTQMRSTVAERITSRLGSAEPFGDGWWTPWDAREPVTHAQHAVASCCRECVEEWHGIPRGRALEETETEYLTELMMRFIDEKVPAMTDEGEYVPAIRSRAS